MISARRRIYLSSPGVCCCQGSGVDTLYRGTAEGDQSGIKSVQALNGKTFLAGRVPEGLLPPIDACPVRVFRVAEPALEEIRPQIEAAVAAYGADKVGLCVGSCDNQAEFSFLAHREYLTNGAFPKNYELRLQGAPLIAEHIARDLGIKGPAITIAEACASSAGAIIRGAELIRAGLCDAVLVGGADVASDTALMGFDSLEAIAPELTNPFSKNRRGINLGEGAAFFLLAREQFPGVPGIYLAGAGESSDAYHLTSPKPDGIGAINAMKAALEDGELPPEAIGYLNLHGTGTLLNDSMEGKAVASIFPQGDLPASSTKPITGHTLGAAGALELAIIWKALKDSAYKREIPLPQHRYDGVKDEAIPPLHLVRPGDTATNLRFAMSVSFAFGGCNVSLVLGRED